MLLYRLDPNSNVATARLDPLNSGEESAGSSRARRGGDRQSDPGSSGAWRRAALRQAQERRGIERSAAASLGSFGRLSNPGSSAAAIASASPRNDGQASAGSSRARRGGDRQSGPGSSGARRRPALRQAQEARDRAQRSERLSGAGSSGARRSTAPLGRRG